jgi:hypothetical protein
MEQTISLNIEISPVLYAALNDFLDCHPDWDLNRAFHAALGRFLAESLSAGQLS